MSRRERPAYNPIGSTHLEMIVAVETLNPLVTLLYAVTGTDMNLLLSFASRAFNHHDRVFLSFQHGIRVSIMSYMVCA